MKLVAGVVAGLFTGASLLTGAPAMGNGASPPFKISLSELARSAKAQTTRYIDVREAYEARSISALKGKTVLNQPLSRLQAKGHLQFDQLLLTFNKNNLLIFLCPTGSRAKLARDYAAKQGYNARYVSLFDERTR